MSWEVALNAAGRFLAAILRVGGVESDLATGRWLRKMVGGGGTLLSATLPA